MPSTCHTHHTRYDSVTEQTERSNEKTNGILWFHVTNNKNLICYMPLLFLVVLVVGDFWWGPVVDFNSKNDISCMCYRLSLHDDVMSLALLIVLEHSWWQQQHLRKNNNKARFFFNKKENVTFSIQQNNSFYFFHFKIKMPETQWNKQVDIICSVYSNGYILFYLCVSWYWKDTELLFYARWFLIEN